MPTHAFRSRVSTLAPLTLLLWQSLELFLMGNTNSSNTTMASVTNLPATKESKRPSFDMTLAVDVSGSMDGAPIRAVNKALGELYTFADNSDRIGLITFNTGMHLN